jgi:hypothetical protein
MKSYDDFWFPPTKCTLQYKLPNIVYTIIQYFYDLQHNYHENQST